MTNALRLRVFPVISYFNHSKNATQPAINSDIFQASITFGVQGVEETR